MIRRALTLALAAALVAGPASAQTIVIVRHGEKVSSDKDAQLSPTGLARAEALAQVFAGSKVDRVISSSLDRTRQTAQPTATLAGVRINAIDFTEGETAHIRRVAGTARQTGFGATVLVVGHSNTIGEIARALGDPSPQAITDCDYDKMTIITIRDEKTPPTVLHTRYGAPTQSC